VAETGFSKEEWSSPKMQFLKASGDALGGPYVPEVPGLIPTAVITPRRSLDGRSNLDPLVTDRYGFVISKDDSAYDPHTASALDPSIPDSKLVIERRQKLEDSRTVKWRNMLNHWETFNMLRSEKVKERIRKGIPDNLRGILATLFMVSSSVPNSYRGPSSLKQFL
jgi:hypothetical protein